jgi:hypothetical protein
VQFPYIKLFPNTQLRPYLKVFLRQGFRTSNEVIALVDSGADFPIFPMEMARDYLKLDLKNAKSKIFSGTTGVQQTALFAEVLLTVLGPEGTKLGEEVLTSCAFCDNLQTPGGALLGQFGFFSLFKTAFHQPDQYFVIERWPENVI